MGVDAPTMAARLSLAQRVRELYVDSMILRGRWPAQGSGSSGRHRVRVLRETL